MEFSDREIDYLESICSGDPRYEEWSKWLKWHCELYDVAHHAVVWTEATILIMAMKETKMDQRYVFKTWNNGKSDEEAFLVKSTALFLLDNGDNRLCDIRNGVMDWLRRDVEDYNFYGKLRKKRAPRIETPSQEYQIVESCETAIMVAEPLQGCRALALPNVKSIKRAISEIIEICPQEVLGMTATMGLVAYYDTVTNGGLKDEMKFMRSMMEGCLDRNAKSYSYNGMECPFDEEQVRASGVSKEAKIVLAVMNYFLNGDYEMRDGNGYKFDDFAVAIYAVMRHEDYWTGTRDGFARMMKRLFDVNVKVGMMSRWIQRHGCDFSKWIGDTYCIEGKRKRIACDFIEMIRSVKAEKLRNI